jgi:hypothetical protein
MENQLWNNIIHVLAGIALGYCLFACKSSKAGCDAYTQKTEIKENRTSK